MNLKTAWVLAGSIFILFSSRLLSLADLQLVSVYDSSRMPVTADSDSSTPVISADGRYVLFSSAANNLVLTNSSGPVPNSVPHYMNTYVRDRVAGTTMLVSVNLQGTGGNGSSFPVEISTNGQYAVYESVADDLVAND